MDKLKTLDNWTYCRKIGSKDKAPAKGLGGSQECMSYHGAVSGAKKLIGGSPYYGYVFGAVSDYIGIDVDVDKEGKKPNSTLTIPREVLEFLTDFPTHVHYSPNKEGIHIFYKLEEELKRKLSDSKARQAATDQKKGDLFAGDWRYRNSFLTVTENTHELSVSTISEINQDQLLKLIPSIGRHLKKGTKKSKNKSEKDEVKNDTDGTNNYGITIASTLNQLKDTLSRLPPTFNHVVERACKQLHNPPATNYEYWVIVGAACAHHETLLEMSAQDDDARKVYDEFLEWSRKDEKGFETEEAVELKYKTLLESTRRKVKGGGKVVTIGSLLCIAKGCIIDFPDMIKAGKKSKETLIPNPASVNNINALMQHDSLELVFDPMGGGVCFKGPEELVKEWFCPSPSYSAYRPPGMSQVVPASVMSVVFLRYMQKSYGYPVAAGHAKMAIDVLCTQMRTTTAFKSWILSAPWDGKKRLDDVCNSITIQEERREYADVYRGYIRNSLLSLVGIHFYPHDAPKINAMLVLTGPEATRKTTWADWLIPHNMEDYKGNASVRDVIESDKDLQALLCSRAVVVVNECEPLFIPKHMPKLKACVDQTSATYRAPYDRIPLSRPRTALMIGTTNKDNLFTDTGGSRKFWIVPVEWCDTDVLNDMDRQQLYAEAYNELLEFKKVYPSKLIQSAWAQSEEERLMTNRLNTDQKGDSIGLMSMFNVLFGRYTDRTFTPGEYIVPSKVRLNHKERTGTWVDPGKNNPLFWKKFDITKLLRIHFEEDMRRYTADDVLYTLQEYSGCFTGTHTKARRLFMDVSKEGGSASALLIKYGCCEINKAKYYIMPTLLKEATSGKSSGVDNLE